MSSLDAAHKKIKAFKQDSLRQQIASLQNELTGTSLETLDVLFGQYHVHPTLLTSALTLKKAAAQINEVVHATGILLALPKILVKDEIIEGLSLAAGNTGQPFDLETNKRVAEFKFIDWKGGPEAIRQNQLFKDFYWLAEHETPKRKELYVLGTEYPLRFFNGRRALSSVLSRNSKLAVDFRQRYEDRFSVVRDYYHYRKDQVAIVDLTTIIPYFEESFL